MEKVETGHSSLQVFPCKENPLIHSLHYDIYLPKQVAQA